MGEGYVDLSVTDDELLDERFDDLSLVLGRQGRPPLVEGIGLVEDIIGGQLVDLQEVNLGFELWKLRDKLVQSRFGRLVELAKTLRGESRFLRERSCEFEGLFFGPAENVSIGRYVRDLELIAKASEQDEWRNTVSYLPL